MAKKSNYPLILRRVPFSLLCILLAVCFYFISKHFYKIANNKDAFLQKLAEYILQIAVLVLIGAAVKEFIDWRTKENERHANNTSLRREFLKRLRDIHLKIMFSRDLMRAHLSAKTWTEQSREIIQRIRELEELYEDLNASSGLFKEQNTIQNGIDGMILYLNKSKDEYIKCHNEVDRDWKNKFTLEDTVKRCNMSWFDEFCSGSGRYESDYVKNLKQAKIPMRIQVYKMSSKSGSLLDID